MAPKAKLKKSHFGSSPFIYLVEHTNLKRFSRHDPYSGSLTLGHWKNWVKSLCFSFAEECRQLAKSGILIDKLLFSRYKYFQTRKWKRLHVIPPTSRWSRKIPQQIWPWPCELDLWPWPWIAFSDTRLKTRFFTLLTFDLDLEFWVIILTLRPVKDIMVLYVYTKL